MADRSIASPPTLLRLATSMTPSLSSQTTPQTPTSTNGIGAGNSFSLPPNGAAAGSTTKHMTINAASTPSSYHSYLSRESVHVLQLSPLHSLQHSPSMVGPSPTQQQSSSSLLPPPPATTAEAEVARNMLTFLLEELSPSVFTKKKEAIDTFTAYYFKIFPVYTSAEIKSIYFGCTSSNLNEKQKGIFALCGMKSWRNSGLKKAAGAALELVSKLCNSDLSPHATHYIHLFISQDTTTLKLLRLEKHLQSGMSGSSSNLTSPSHASMMAHSMPSTPSSALHSHNSSPAVSPTSSVSSRGNRQAALYLLSVLLQYRSELFDTIYTDLSKELSDDCLHELKEMKQQHTKRLVMNAGLRGNGNNGNGIGSSNTNSSAYSTDTLILSSSTPTHSSYLNNNSNNFSNNNNSSTDLLRRRSVYGGVGVHHHNQPESRENALAMIAERYHSIPNNNPIHQQQSHHNHTQSQYQGGAHGQQHHHQHAVSSMSPSSMHNLSSPSNGKNDKNDGKKEKSSISSRLRAFFGGARPPMHELESKGLIKSKSFGISLEEIYKNSTLVELVETELPSSPLHSADSFVPHEGSTVYIPCILKQCCTHMITEGIIQLQGIFRLSGDSIEIAQLKEKYDSGITVNLSEVGAHSVSGLVKLYLRLLPEPLLRYENYDILLEMFRKGEHEKDEKMMTYLKNNLSVPHYSTLTYLLDFLSHVNAYESINRMTDANLSICFSPNILRPKVETYEKVAKDTPTCIGVVKFLIAQHVVKMKKLGLLWSPDGPEEEDEAVQEENVANGEDATTAATTTTTTASSDETIVITKITDETNGGAIDATLIINNDKAPDTTPSTVTQQPSSPLVDKNKQFAFEPVMNKDDVKTAPELSSSGGAGSTGSLRTSPHNTLAPSGTAAAAAAAAASGSAVISTPTRATPARRPSALLTLPPSASPHSSPRHRPTSSGGKPSLSRQTTPLGGRRTPTTSPKYGTLKPSVLRTSSITRQQANATLNPNAIPDHFERFRDPATGNYYYFNKLTQKVTWKKPDWNSDKLDEDDERQVFPPPLPSTTPPPLEGDEITEADKSNASSSTSASSEKPPLILRAASTDRGHTPVPIYAPLSDGESAEVIIRAAMMPAILPKPPVQPRKKSSSAFMGQPLLAPPPPVPEPLSPVQREMSAEKVETLEVQQQRQRSPQLLPQSSSDLSSPKTRKAAETMVYDDGFDDSVQIIRARAPLDIVMSTKTAESTPTNAAAATTSTTTAAAPTSTASTEQPPPTAPYPIDRLISTGLIRSPASSPSKAPNKTAAGGETMPALGLPATSSTTASAASSTATISKDDDALIEEDQDWEEYTDSTSGRIYFYNKHTKTTTWQNPFTKAADANGAAAVAGGTATATTATPAVTALPAGPSTPATHLTSSSSYPSPLYSTWNSIHIHGKWTPDTATGCYPNYVGWSRGPQYHVGIVSRPETKALTQVVIQMQWSNMQRVNGVVDDDKSSASAKQPAGFYILTNHGPSYQKLFLHADEIVARSEFRKDGNVTVNILLDSFSTHRPGSGKTGEPFVKNYIIMPSTLEPGYTGDFTLTVHSADETWIQPVSNEEKWIETRVTSQWLGDTAGGCRNHTTTFTKNPHFQLTSSILTRNSPVLCVLTQEMNYSSPTAAASSTATDATPTLHPIGWYAINSSTGQIEAKGPIQAQQATHNQFEFRPIVESIGKDGVASTAVVVSQEPTSYILIPCTFQPGQEAKFTLSVFSPPDSPMQLVSYARV